MRWWGLLGLLASSGCADAPIPPRVDVPITADVAHYPVLGRTIQELRESMAGTAPLRSDGKRWPGYTHRLVESRWTFRARLGQCAFETVTVSLALTTTLPVAVYEAELPASEADRWRRFLLPLAEHERIHAVISERGVRHFADMFANAEPARSCAIQEARGDRIHQAMLAWIRAEQLRYDTLTDHGARQARWGPGEVR